MKHRFVALAVVLLAAVVIMAPAQFQTARATTAIEVRSQQVQNSFPGGARFVIFLGSSAEITQVRLNYRILPDGSSVGARAQCTTGNSISCNVAIGGSAAAFIVTGADIVYSWSIDDASGAHLETPEETYRYLDPRFQWQPMTEGNVTVFYYSGSDDSNRGLLNAARETIDRMSPLLGTTIDFPVKLWAYATAADLSPAVLSNRNIRPNQNNPTTLGEVVFSDTALVSRDTQALDIVRHEITHIIMRRALRGALGDAPAWLDEGIAVYAQRNVLPDETVALEQAIRGNRALSIFSLTSNALTQTNTSLFYAQSWSTVKYLIDSQPPGKFAEFLTALKSDTTDNAMRKTYGFDQAGLEDRWRQSVNLPALNRSQSGSSNSNDLALPTIALSGAGGSSSAPAATPVAGNQGSTSTTNTADDSGGSSILPIAAGAVIAILVIGGAGFFIARRKGSSNPGA